MKIDRNQRARLDAIYHSIIEYVQRNDRVGLEGCILDGSSMLDVSILNIIERTPDCIIKDIGAVLGSSPSTLTSAIDRLERRNLLTRVISRRDRRSFALELTDFGKKAMDEHRESEKRFFDGILAFLDDGGERDAFLSAFEKIRDGFLRNEARIKTARKAEEIDT